MQNAIKQWLVSSPASQVALSLRSSATWLGSHRKHKEAAGTTANDLAAEWLVVRLCKPDFSFVDVGAHIGSIIAGVIANCPRVEIFAIEAIPRKVERLRKDYPTVEVFQCAAGEAESVLPFFVNESRSGYSSLLSSHRIPADKILEILVEVKTLDALFTSQPVDVVKIDVEGAELGVLRGASALVDRCRPSFMFESASPANATAALERRELWEWFSQHDYALLIPNRLAHVDNGLSLDGFIEAHIYPRRTTNYFAIARERRDEIMHRARVLMGFHSDKADDLTRLG